MSAGLALLFWALLLLQTKHFLCDFVLQSTYQLRNKGRYGHPGGFLHAGLHALTSVPALFVLSDAVLLIAEIAAVEFAVHYHLDWLKEQISKRRGLTHEHTLFWIVFGADQFLHQLTYVGMLAVLVRAAGM